MGSHIGGLRDVSQAQEQDEASHRRVDGNRQEVLRLHGQDPADFGRAEGVRSRDLSGRFRAVTTKAWQFEPDDAQVTSTPLPDAFYHSSPDEQEVWELAVTAGHNLVTATSTLEGDEVVKISAKVMDGSADGF